MVWAKAHSQIQYNNLSLKAEVIVNKKYADFSPEIYIFITD